MLSRIRPLVLVIQGNHDDRGTFRRRLGDLPGLAPSGPLHPAAGGLGPARIFGADVTVPDAHHREMDDAARAWLTDRWAEEPDRPTITMLHQPPFDAGIPYIDRYNCRGGDRLAEIASRFPAVERVLCGHIHRHMQLRSGGAIAATAPSTTTAISLRLRYGAKPASFVEPPAMPPHH